MVCHPLFQVPCACRKFCATSESSWAALCCCAAGLVYDCPRGLSLVNTGNVPLSVAVPDASHSLGMASGCLFEALQPGRTVYCDFTWSVSQEQLDLGQALVQMTATAQYVKQPGASLTFTGSSVITPQQYPGINVDMVVKDAPRVVLLGKPRGRSAQSGLY